LRERRARVAEDLTGRGKDVLILDRDESRVEALRDQDLNARVQDIADPDVVEAIDDPGHRVDLGE